MLSGRILHGVDVDLRFSQVKAPVPSPKCEKTFLYNYLRGLPVAILVNVNDSKGGVEGLEVVATVENPDGSTNRLTLYDDGGHEDGLAGDGIYGNLYTRTFLYSNGGVPDFPDGPPSGENGSYNVSVAVRGESNYGEKFQRYAGRSFQVFEFDTKADGAGCKPDQDGDGLPDRWEDLYGLNKTNPADANRTRTATVSTTRRNSFTAPCRWRPTPTWEARPTVPRSRTVATRSSTRMTCCRPSSTTGSSRNAAASPCTNRSPTPTSCISP